MDAEEKKQQSSDAMNPYLTGEGCGGGVVLILAIAGGTLFAAVPGWVTGIGALVSIAVAFAVYAHLRSGSE